MSTKRKALGKASEEDMTSTQGEAEHKRRKGEQNQMTAGVTLDRMEESDFVQLSAHNIDGRFVDKPIRVSPAKKNDSARDTGSVAVVVQPAAVQEKNKKVPVVAATVAATVATRTTPSTSVGKRWTGVMSSAEISSMRTLLASSTGTYQAVPITEKMPKTIDEDEHEARLSKLSKVYSVGSVGLA